MLLWYDYLMKRLATRIHIFLSHHTFLYAFIVGVGIVLFWRGVWHTVDLIHLYISHYHATASIDLAEHPWWDGPLSLLAGSLILYISRAFVSSFIGNELILSGLRTEKKLPRKTEDNLKTEVSAITDIKDEIETITHKLGDLEEQIKDHHTK